MATAIGAFVTWFSTLSPITQGLLRLGAGLLLNTVVAKRQKPRTNYQELQQEFQQTDAVGRGHYGRVLVSGVRAFWAHLDGTMHKILILGTGATDAVEKVLFDGVEVTLDGSGDVTTPQFVVAGSSVVNIQTRLGAVPSTAYASTVALFPEWTSEHRLDGLTTILQACERVAPDKVREVYPTGDAPQMQAVIRGRPCYDPRTTATAWTETPVLQLLAYLTDPDGGAEGLAEFDLESWEAMADLAEEAVPLNAGGSEPRYRCALSYRYDEPIKDLVNRFLGTFNGRIRERPDGKIGLTGGAWAAPTYTIEEQHVIAIDYGPGDAGLTAYSELVSRYVDPLAQHTAQTTDPWQDSGLVARIGGVVSEPAERLEVPSHSQCRRLDKQQIAFDNPEFRLGITLRFFGLLLLDQDTVYVNLPSRGLSNVPFWIDSIESSEDFTMFTVALRSADPTAFDWDETTEEGTPPSYPAPVAESGEAPAPVGLAADVVGGLSGGTSVLSLSATWAAPAGLVGHRAIARYRLAPSGAWQLMAVADDGLSAVGGPLLQGSSYDVQAYYTRSPAYSEPGVAGAGAVAEVTGVFAEPTALVISAAAGLGTLTMSAVLAPGTERIRLYRGASADFAAATPISPIYYVGIQSTATIAAGDFADLNLFADPGMDSGAGLTLGTGWTISGGVASHAAGVTSDITQTIGTLVAGEDYRWAYVQAGRTAGNTKFFIDGATFEPSASAITDDQFFGTLTCPASPTAIGVRGSSAYDGNIDNVVFYRPTAASLEQGTANFWISPVTAWGAPTGTPIGPVAATIL